MPIVSFLFKKTYLNIIIYQQVMGNGSDIVTGTTATLRPAILNRDKLFLTLSVQYLIPSGYSNLGPKRLSLLEFETWRLRPLGHQGQS